MDLPTAQPPTAIDFGTMIEAARREALERRRRFLAAWKRVVLLAGKRYFRIAAPSVEAATSKDQLCPDYYAIKADIGPVSQGEGAFRAAMYSFFNSHDGQELLAAAGYPNLCDLAAKLEGEHAEVIAELFLSYHGW